VYAADFNHDGRMDIAFSAGGYFGIRLQNASGGFNSASMYKNAAIDGVTFSLNDIVVGDVTGDGYPDVVTDSNANRPWSGVEVFADTARGTLKAPVVYPTLDIPAAMAVADLNGDGRDDLVIEHSGWDNIGVMLQRSAGTLAPEALYPASCCTNDQPSAGDLNHDGRPDIAVVGGSGAAIFYGK
jgi:hypothetical protein